MRYLRETLSADPLALFSLGPKRCLKAGAALHAGLEYVPPGATRKLAGCYVLFACFQLDTLVDALPDFSRALLVHQFVREGLAQTRPLADLKREVRACRQLSRGERMKTVLLLSNLDRLVRATESVLDSPQRRSFFRERLSSLISAVVEDMNLREREQDTLFALAPEYPAMGLSGLEVLWLLQGHPVERILSYRPVLSVAEQLARLEDDVLEVWKALRDTPDEDKVEQEIDRRNLILRHARNLRWSMRASLEEACRIAGLLERRLEEQLQGVEDERLAFELRRVVNFFPSFVDMLIGPHRVAPEAPGPESARPELLLAGGMTR